jgi:23S rRNA (pseudouridine1915-N3)-methyltransferase
VARRRAIAQQLAVKLSIVAVGNRMPAWVSEGFTDYIRRMPREARVELIEVKPEKRAAGRMTAQILAAERNRIEAGLPRDAQRVALDERGNLISSHGLAEWLRRWKAEGQDAAFVIGSADGLDESLKKSSHYLLSLSKMTLPHGLVRVLLAEQLYRAVSLIQNHPYHRE